MIVVPEGLKKAVEEFRERLLGEREVIIYHDTDPDGIVAGALLKKFLKENGIGVEAFARDRREVSFKEGKTYVLADIRIDERILEEAKKRGVKIYYIDHHEPVGVTENTVVLNPWFVEGLPVEPYRYITALLAWLLEGMPKEDEWKVAAAHWADHAEEEHTREWMEKMRKRYPVEEVGKYLALPDHFPELSLDEMRERVIKASHPSEILEDPELKRRMELLERELKRWGKVLESKEGPVVYLVVESPVRKLRSPLATIYSVKYPHRVHIIGQRDDGTISYSLRFQSAKEKGVHLGEIAREAGRLFGGNGGGHPPAAGLTIPAEKEPEFREWVVERLEKGVGDNKITWLFFHKIEK